MKNTTRTLIAATAALTAVSAFVLPARAALTGDTTTTFTLTAGALAITTPASVNLGSAASGAGVAAAQLGAVAVSDSRGANLGSWTTSVASTDFTTGTATANETIAKANADYWSGAATATSGTGVFTPGQLTTVQKVTLGASRTAFSAATVVGNNTVTFNPTVIINTPAQAVAGVYSGTITHSIA